MKKILMVLAGAASLLLLVGEEGEEMKMSVRCEGCALLGSIRCPECMEGGFCFYKPLVELHPPNQKMHKPCTSPTAEVVPITNEMHLRAMSQQELVNLLYNFYLHSAEFDGGEITRLWCDGNAGCIDADGEVQCDEDRHKACILRWLNAPYVPKEEAT